VDHVNPKIESGMLTMLEEQKPISDYVSNDNDIRKA